MMMAFGFEGQGMGGGGALKEKRRCRHLLKVTVFPGFTSLGRKADDLEASQIKLVPRSQ